MTAENFFRTFLVVAVIGLARALHYGVKKWVLHKWKPRLNRSAKKYWRWERPFWVLVSAGLATIWIFAATRGTNVENGLWPFMLGAGMFVLVAVVYEKLMEAARCKMAEYTRRRLPGYIRRNRHEAYLRRMENCSAAQAKAAILDAGLCTTEDAVSVVMAVGPEATDPYADVELDPEDAEDWEESDQKLSVTGMLAEGVRQFMERPSEPAEIVEMPVGVRELKPEPESEPESAAVAETIVQSERAEVLKVIVPFKEREKVLQYLPVGGCRPTM